MRTKLFLVFAGLCLGLSPMPAQVLVSAPVDPFILPLALDVNSVPQPQYTNTNGLTQRTQAFNPAARNIALIVAGQSNCASVNPTAYTPSSSSVIDNFNINDGGSYSINGAPLVGVQSIPVGSGSNPTVGGPGNVGSRLAQLFITNNIFDHVLLVPVCIGGTSAANWASGTESQRIPVALGRLASRGITPTTTGWSFAISWWQGETDNTIGTSSASYQSSGGTVLSNAQAAGFTCANCRFFVNIETQTGSGVSAAIQAAQAALVTNNPTHFFTGGNIDTLPASTVNRQADLEHLNDVGAQAAAQLVYNAMHASGAPF